MSKDLSLIEHLSNQVTDLGNLCREIPFDEQPLVGTGLGAIYDALLVFSDRQNDPGAIVVFEADALISYVEFEDDNSPAESTRVEKAIELGQRISEAAVSIAAILDSD